LIGSIVIACGRRKSNVVETISAGTNFIGLFSQTFQEAIAEEQRMASRFSNDIQIAKAQRDFELKKAAYDMEVQTEKAKSELSYDLQVRPSYYKPSSTLVDHFAGVSGFPPEQNWWGD
jgi:hypothetical protein